MAFSSTLLRMVAPLSLSGHGTFWAYGPTTQATSDVSIAGFFTACGYGSRNGVAGMRFGDLVAVMCNTGTTLTSTGRVGMHSVINATANQASTSGSTGWGANYDASINTTTT